MPHRSPERPIDRAIRLWLTIPPQAPETKASLASFARAMGVEPQDVNNWKKRGMPPEWHAKAAQIVNLSIDELVYGEIDPGEIKDTWDSPGSGAGSLREPRLVQSATQRRTPVWRLMVSEVVKAVAGGRIESIPSDRAGLGYVELHGAPHGLKAIRVRGDGLAPSVDDGRVLIVAPTEECEPDEWVLLSMRDGTRLVKKLLITKADAVVVSDLVSQEQRSIARDEIEAMHPITAVYSSKRWSPGKPNVAQ